MSDNDLVERLREMASWEDGVGVMQDFYCGDEMIKAADRIEALTEQLEAARLDAKEAEAKLAKVVALIDEASVEGLDDGYGWKWILVKVSPRGESAKSALPSQN